MYLGRIVEYGPVDEVYTELRHPYTRALMSAVPVPDPKVERARERILLQGDLPSPTEEVVGCNFRVRCPLYKALGAEDQARCAAEDPVRRPVGASEVACHHTEKISLLDTGSGRKE